MKTQRKKVIAERNKAEKRRKTAATGMSRKLARLAGKRLAMDEPFGSGTTTAGPSTSGLPSLLSSDDDEPMPGLEALD